MPPNFKVSACPVSPTFLHDVTLYGQYGEVTNVAEKTNLNVIQCLWQLRYSVAYTIIFLSIQDLSQTRLYIFTFIDVSPCSL